MPLDPVVLMALGGALLVVVAAYRPPKAPIGALWRFLRHGGPGGARQDHPDPPRPRSAPDDGFGPRAALPWLGILLGGTSIAYGVYLRWLV